MDEVALDDCSFLRLLAWSSPGFPIGAFAFSHGLEAAVTEGLVRDAGTLAAYVRAACCHGSGLVDAVLLARSYEGATDDDATSEVVALAAALRGSAELALEAGMQGGAALRTLRLAWPHPLLERLDAIARSLSVEPALPVVNGVAAQAHGLPVAYACLAQLAAFSANLISAGVRLVPLGQTDGQRVTAGLEDYLPATAARAMTTPLEDLATSAPIIDLLSIAHETQYTRLFRS